MRKNRFMAIQKIAESKKVNLDAPNAPGPPGDAPKQTVSVARHNFLLQFLILFGIIIFSYFLTTTTKSLFFNEIISFESYLRTNLYASFNVQERFFSCQIKKSNYILISLTKIKLKFFHHILRVGRQRLRIMCVVEYFKMNAFDILNQLLLYPFIEHVSNECFNCIASYICV